MRRINSLLVVLFVSILIISIIGPRVSAAEMDASTKAQLKTLTDSIDSKLQQGSNSILKNRVIAVAEQRMEGWGILNPIRGTMTILIAGIIVLAYLAFKSIKMIYEKENKNIIKASLTIISMGLVTFIVVMFVFFILMFLLYAGYAATPLAVSILALGLSAIIIVATRKVPYIRWVTPLLPPFLFAPLILLDTVDWSMGNAYYYLTSWAPNLLGKTGIITAGLINTIFGVIFLTFFLWGMFKFESFIFEIKEKGMPLIYDERIASGNQAMKNLRKISPNKAIKKGRGLGIWWILVIPIAIVLAIIWPTALGDLISWLINNFIMRGVLLGVWMILGPAAMFNLLNYTGVGFFEDLGNQWRMYKAEKELKARSNNIAELMEIGVLRSLSETAKDQLFKASLDLNSRKISKEEYDAIVKSIMENLRMR